MKKRLQPLLLSFSLLCSCAAGAVDQVKPIPDVPGEVHVPSLTDQGDPYGAYASFALNLLEASRSEGDNALLSPLSVLLALGMTANGAGGDTLKEFESLFGMDAETLNALAAQMMADYSNLDGSTEATLVNSLWCAPDLTLDGLFTARCRQIYAAQLYQADLQDAATVKAVNDWVSEATKGLIPGVVDKFSSQAVLALVNALYLKNQFEQPFKTPTSDWEMDFTADDGTVGHPKGMDNGTRNELCLFNDNAQGVILPYDDGRLGLMLLLPDVGVSLTDCLASLDGASLTALLAEREERLCSLVVPKFELEWDGALSGPLQAMGLAGAFDPGSADFTAMGTCPNGPLYIGDVIHKTVLKVNEKGTEAAAVTVAIMDCGAAMPPDDLVVLHFDRPFLCGIVDLDTGAPIFLGTVEDLG